MRHRFRLVHCHIALMVTGCVISHQPHPVDCGQPAGTKPLETLSPGDAGKAAGAPPSQALESDEGMWLLNDFPSKRLERLHGFAPSQEWLEHVQLASLRIAGGCSGSFVSARGLVLTNHHCVSQCIQQLSNGKRDLMKSGFYASTAKQELACPDMEIDQLLTIDDVTERLEHATAGRTGGAFHEALEGQKSRIEAECATSDELRCDVVSLYHGGRYHLYKYRRFQDIRLVFAPEMAAAYFGGYPDNFMFPRSDLDVAFLRVYDGQVPLTSSEYFRWAASAPTSAGELTFVPGHPWHTSRELTVAQLEVLRDQALPTRLLDLAQARGMLTQYRRAGPEQERHASHLLFSVENSLKALSGRVAALRDPKVFGAKVAEEQELRARVERSPTLQALTAGAWESIESAEREFNSFRIEYRMLEQAQGFWSELFEHARRLVRIAAETTKPNTERLREYSESQRPSFTRRVLSPSIIHEELDILTLTHSLTKLRETLGVDHQAVIHVLGKQTPGEVATRVVRGTQLKDVAFRSRLLAGGQAALDTSRDPMIALARVVEPVAREVRKRYEERVEAIVAKSAGSIARARFAVYGTSTYPDATATLRLSFGRILGYEDRGRQVAPFATFARAFERATGKEPFALPQSWLTAEPRLDRSMPLNFCTTNDIIGGNSGSPVIDRSARVIGVIFDGNIHSLGGDYVYEPDTNRAVAVHGSAILHALDRIYGARRVLDELNPVASVTTAELVMTGALAELQAPRIVAPGELASPRTRRTPLHRPPSELPGRNIQ